MNPGDLLLCIDDHRNRNREKQLEKGNIYIAIRFQNDLNDVVFIQGHEKSWNINRFINLNQILDEHEIIELKVYLNIQEDNSDEAIKEVNVGDICHPDNAFSLHFNSYPYPIHHHGELTVQERVLVSKAIKKHGNYLIEISPNGKIIMHRNGEVIKLN